MILWVLHASIKLLGKHFKCKVFFRSSCFKAAVSGKLVYGGKFFTEIHIHSLLFQFKSINDIFVGTIIDIVFIDHVAFGHEIAITDIKLIFLYCQIIFYHNEFALSCCDFFVCCICISLYLFQNVIHFSNIFKLCVQLCAAG